MRFVIEAKWRCRVKIYQAISVYFKWAGSPDGLSYFLHAWIDLGLNKPRRWFFDFLRCSSADLSLLPFSAR
jgi:hypothetical protein